MELNEFLERFGVRMGRIDAMIKENINGFSFPEALQNFANKLCKKQIENCVKAIEYGYDGYELCDCENAEQPKIEEL